MRIVAFSFLPILWLLTAIFFFFSLPALVYLALYHPDRLIPYVARIVGSIPQQAGGLVWFVSLGVSFALLLFGTIESYRRQRKSWRDAQEELAQGKDITVFHVDHPMTLPSPTQPPLVRTQIMPRDTLRTFLIVECAIVLISLIGYMTWSQMFFRWPPNPVFDHVILGLTLGFFVFASAFAMRIRPVRIIADHTGIVFHRRLIPWSQVRQLVLTPVYIGAKTLVPMERYSIVTTTSTIVFDAPTAPRQTPEQDAAHAFVAFVMLQTHLPLLVDSLELRRRDEYLAAPQSAQSQKGRQQTTTLAFIGPVLSIIAIGCLVPLAQQLLVTPHYHSVSGQLAKYTYDKGYDIRLVGDPVHYWLANYGVWPDLPAHLPNGTPVTMLVDGVNVDVLDVYSGNLPMRYITQSYAEPWSNWIEFITFSIFLAGGGGVGLALSLRSLWRRFRGIALEPSLALFPPPDYTAPPE
jgi:hypothetical protein